MPATIVDLAPRVAGVEPLDDYALLVTFVTGEVRKVDCLPFLEKGVFRELKNVCEFSRVEPINGGSGIGWASGADLSRDTVYALGQPV